MAGGIDLAEENFGHGLAAFLARIPGLQNRRQVFVLPRQRGIGGFMALRPRTHFSAAAVNQRNGFACPSRLRAWPISTSGWVHLASCVTPSVLITRKEVQEC